VHPRLLAASLAVLLAISASVQGAGALEHATSGPAVRSVFVSPPSDAALPVVAGLLGVSCVGIAGCWAVGDYQRPKELTGPMAVKLVHGRGVGSLAISLPPPADPSGYALLVSVSCTTMRECVAVGTYSTPGSGGRSGNELPMVAISAGGHWQRAIAVSLPSSAAIGTTAAGYLADVSCIRTIDCVAVGGFLDRGGNERAFRVAISPRPPTGAMGHGVEMPFAPLAGALGAGAEDAQLSGVSCWAPSDCVAVGSVSVRRGSRSVAVIEETRHARWVPEVVASLPPTAGPAASSSGLGAVSCPTPGRCIAVGTLQVGGSGGTSLGLVTTRGRAGWSWAPLLTGPAGHSLLLQSVACVPGGSACSATGYVSSYDDVTMTASTAAALSIGKVSALHAPTSIRLPTGSGGAANFRSLESIDCSTPRLCTAVGRVTDIGGHIIAYSHPVVVTVAQ
jgi:hypothetical protein